MLMVTVADEFGAMVPTATGSPGAATEPTFKLVNTTLFAVVPPTFVRVNCTTTLFEPSRLNTLVGLILGPDGGWMASTSMVVETEPFA
jgi:hypothetical protein